MMKSKVKDIIVTFLIFAIVASAVALATRILFAIVPIQGSSMHPTVEDGESVFILKVGNFDRGDIVVIENSTDDGKKQRLIKRIIALEGDTVETRTVDGKERYFVNDEMLDEPYVNNGATAKGRQPRVTVPEGCFYYLGDNRLVSADSYSPSASGVKMGELDHIIGKVLFCGNFKKFEFSGV